MPAIPRVVIAAAASGAGKTTFACGIAAAFAARGLKVQPFKVGPDYIDPSHLSAAAGRKARNLDAWLLGAAGVREVFARASAGADVAVVEGVMGLLDGAAGEGDAGSTAEVARILRAPVLLVLSAKGAGRSIGAAALGLARAARGIRVSGILLNHVGSARHLSLARGGIQEIGRLPVLGSLPRADGFAIPERHLGLVPSGEGDFRETLGRVAAAAAQGCDLGAVLAAARGAPRLPDPAPRIFRPGRPSAAVRLAVARDPAFLFYYEDNLDILGALGAEAVPFSPLSDAALPEGVHGLYVGGGFPESFGEALAANRPLREGLRTALSRGLPAYAECGGLMFMTEAVVDARGAAHPMVGAIPGRAVMQAKRQALGYVRVRVTRDNLLTRAGDEVRGHEFHWSALEGLPPETPFCYASSRGGEDASRRDGIQAGSLFAAYTHLHFGGCRRAPERLLAAMRRFRGRSG